MFRESGTIKQQSIFGSVSSQMNPRESTEFDDPEEWHNLFYAEVTAQIDEKLFEPLFCARPIGAPTKGIRTLVGMMILKAGTGISDQQLFDGARYNVKWRRALGLATLHDPCPAPSTYYRFRRLLQAYAQRAGVDLVEACFAQLTTAQALSYNVVGKLIRVDSKLTGSNIARYSRYRIVQATLAKELKLRELDNLSLGPARALVEEFLREDVNRTEYSASQEEIDARMQRLGEAVRAVLAGVAPGDKQLLRRVFGEQYEVETDGRVHTRPQSSPGATSVQNPHDPEATHRRKRDQCVRGYSTNITETFGQPGAPNLITDVQVRPANAQDCDFLALAVARTGAIVGRRAETVLADGAYQSPANRRLAEAPGSEFRLVTGCIPGRKPRFELILTDGRTLTVTDAQTGETMAATPIRDGVWRIRTQEQGGGHKIRYFTREDVARREARRAVDAYSPEELKQRSNVEATIFQFCSYLRNNKTRYRGLIKHRWFALTRCLWINLRRLYLFVGRGGHPVAV